MSADRIGEAILSIGNSATHEDGTVIRFDRFREFAAIQVSHDPGQVGVLISASSMPLGLLATLLVRRERVFAPTLDTKMPRQASGRRRRSRCGIRTGRNAEAHERLRERFVSQLGDSLLRRHSGDC